MTFRKHAIFIFFTTIELMAVLVILLQNRAELREKTATLVPQEKVLVRQLELTDLAIWTEARYTRHPSQADLFSPFQDGPSAPDHFPAGSVVAAPRISGTEGAPAP